MDSRVFFKETYERHKTLAKDQQSKIVRIAAFRASLFVAAIILFIYLINLRELGLALALVFMFIIAFGLLVRWHNQAKFMRNQNGFIADINNEELLRLNNELSSLSSGDEYISQKHDFANDLDIFGTNSIFQLINRTSTTLGKEIIAKRLLGKDLISDLQEYQESVKEMSASTGLIQYYQALGRHVDLGRDDFESFKEWLSSPQKVSKMPAMRIYLWALPLLFFILLLVAWFFSLTYYITLPVVIVNTVLLARNHKHAASVVEKTTAAANLLKSFQHHIELIENREFSSSFLSRNNKYFTKADERAKHAIKKLAYLLSNLQTRNNKLHIFFNIPLLMDLQWLIRLEDWREANRKNVDDWLNAFAENEVVFSLAAQAFAQPEWCYPEFATEVYFLETKSLGHPLVPRKTRAYNDFAFQGKGNITLLTGPNMAGKSTFLRTVAINIILAKLGGLVCAKKFTVNKDMEIFTAMRINDNLGDGISSFYAELDRINQLLKLIDTKRPILFFLDELLKGTNSEDRHKGAEALIKQLISLNASGFISTHDIALGELASILPEVKNYSFESDIVEGEIIFDYKLRDGVCKSFNACELMRQMGINV